MTNADASVEHFSFNVQEQFAVLTDVRSKGMKLGSSRGRVGHFISL